MARRPDLIKDQELINILKQNARMPLAEIAKTLGVSRATIQSRLSRLERDGFIAGYTIISGIDTGALELISAIILVELELRIQNRIVSDLKKIPEVTACYTTSGQHDLFVRIRCRTPADLDAIIDEIACMEGVRRTTSSILLTRKFER